MAHFKYRNGKFVVEDFNSSILGENPVFQVDVTEYNLTWPPQNDEKSQVALTFLKFINSTYKTDYQSFGIVQPTKSYDNKTEELTIQLQTKSL